MSDEAIDLLAREGLRLAALPAHAAVTECTPAAPLPFAPDDPSAPFGHGPAPAFEAILDAVNALEMRLARIEAAIRAIPPPAPPAAPVMDTSSMDAAIEALTRRFVALEELIARALAGPAPMAAPIDTPAPARKKAKKRRS
ncbi:MAG: hypothetical protein IT302_14015 [Dehalococcoidia bacterium]|nr:hypothetical protein [Dehalococcoidia bacterium]